MTASSALPPSIQRLLPPVAALLLLGTLFAAGVYLYLSPQLPAAESLKHFQFETPLKVLTREGTLIAEFGEKHSSPLHYDQVPPLLMKAFLAAEDDRFFTHEGIDPKGLARAFFELATTGSIRSGGSTITMQVAKNYFLSNERTFSRKFTEILLAREIEQSLSKEEILTLYVNKIFLGHRAYGIQAAAQIYYGKNVDRLSLAQMAMIAGLPKAPSKYNPIDNPKRALLRRDWILGRMLQLGYIAPAQHQAARQEAINLSFRGQASLVNGPYLAELVRDDLVQRFGEEVYSSGWKVYTTAIANRQNAATESVQAGLLAYDRRHGWRGAEAHDKDLGAFRVVGNLAPAKIIAVGRQEAMAALKDGSEIRIPWSGLSWARPYISATRTGASPRSAAEVVRVGDIVRLLRQGDSWQLAQIPAAQGALIALQPESGAVEAMVGGFDYFTSKFNRATQGWRQAGSTLKPFLYAAALEQGYTPATLVNDAPLSFGEGANAWRPSNADGDFMGPITLRRGLYLSRNLVSIRLMQAIGIDRARGYISRFGFPANNLSPNLTLALGSANVLPIQMATGFASFANGGYRITPHFIERIEDVKGRIIFQANPVRVCRECELAPAPAQPAELIGSGTDLQVIEPPPPVRPNYPQAPRIVTARAAFQMDSILKDVIVRGTGRGALHLNRIDIAGKTGTTNDARDAWFAGFTPDLVAVTWVGFDDPATLGSGEYGGVAALPLWTGFMQQALAGTPARSRPVPAGLTAVRINKITGKRTLEGDPDARIDYIQVEKVPAEPIPDTPEATEEAAPEEQTAPEEIF